MPDWCYQYELQEIYLLVECRKIFHIMRYMKTICNMCSMKTL